MAVDRTPMSGGSEAAPMLRRVRDLQSYTMGATDGDIGEGDDLYFDDPTGWVDRNYETRYYEHYGRPTYWDRRPESWRRYPPGPSTLRRR